MSLKDKEITLIYNSYGDKDYESVLKILKPIINKIIIIELEDKRIVDKNNLLKNYKELNIINQDTIKIEQNEIFSLWFFFSC